MQNFFVFLGLTLLLGRSFPLSDFALFLPSDIFQYPRQSISNTEFTAILWGVSLVGPAMIVALFMWRSRLSERIQHGAGLTLLKVGACIVLAQWALRFFAAFVPGGGGLFTVNVLLAELLLPVKLLLLVGAVLLFTNLKARVA